MISYWSPLHALWRPPGHNVCSDRNNSTRSERTQTRLSRRLHKRWYRAVIYRGRRVGERERGSRMKKLTTTATKGGIAAIARSVGRKSEWEHCAPDGLVASSHLALPMSIRFHCYFIIIGRDPRPYNTRDTTDDNRHATDPWQSAAFYGLSRFIVARFFSSKSEGIRRSVGAVYSLTI